MDNIEIAVSVICLTYNHEKYIRDCLEGFVSQKTNFVYEVIIHDDASTDGTAGIIREYEERYPGIIRPIYQTQNQFSQKVPIYKNYVLPKIRGKFVALCEGDDYWIDPHKLQRQYDGMVRNPHCSMCTHKVTEVNQDGIPNGVCFPNAPIDTGALPSEHFFDICKQYSFHTSSYFFRTEQFLEYRLNPPEFVRKCDVGDETMLLYFGMLGNVLYLEDEMSCYRRGAAVSWSAENYKSVDKMISHGHQMIETLKAFDVYSQQKYHDIIRDRIALQMAKTVILEKNAHVLLRKENYEYFKCLTSSRKLFVLLSIGAPQLIKRVYIHRINKLTSRRGVC